MDPKDITFLKSGFNNLVEEDETVENVASIIILFMENAIKSASIYIKHCKRNTITKEDVKRAFMLEVFLMKKRGDNLQRCEEIKNKIKQIMNEEDEQIEEEEEYEDEEDEFCESKCTCAMCNCLNTIYDRWGQINLNELTPMEKILHRHIDTI